MQDPYVVLVTVGKPVGLRVLVLHPGITPLGNDPEWFKITRFYPETCLNGVSTQVYSQGVIQKNPRVGQLSGAAAVLDVQHCRSKSSALGASASQSLAADYMGS